MSRQSGFTLIEVLIGTTLLSIMVALLTSALFGIARTARVGDQRFDSVDSARLVQSFLRRELTRVVPLTEVTGEKQRVLFEGRADRLRLVGQLPAHRGGGGLQFLEIALDPRSAGRELDVYYSNAWPETSFESFAASADKRPLASGVKRVRFRYFGEKDDDSRAEWSDTWAVADRLPALIELDVDTVDGRSWPRIVAAVASRTAVAQQQLFRLHESAR